MTGYGNPEPASAETVAQSWPVWKERLRLQAAPHFEGGLRLQAEPGRARRAAGTPLVSYITVVRNAVHTLERTLASVAAQAGAQVEHIVLDGASTDGTLALLQRHAGTLAYCASAPDGGLYDALNRAIELATGDLLCVLNADDWLTAPAAAVAARTWTQAGRPARALICTGAWVHEGSSKSVWLPQRIDEAAVLSCANICHNGVYATRQAYEASGRYRTEFRIAADFAWLIQCQRAGVVYLYEDEPTVNYQLGGLSSDAGRHTQECLQVLRLNVPNLSEAEAWGLLHAFHALESNLASHAATRPAHLGRFLLDLARRHADDSVLMRALAPAALARMTHEADGTPAGRLTRGAKFRRSLHKIAWALKDRWGRAG
jgi:glycosyltransferase involved in cell wall biosynthesis